MKKTTKAPLDELSIPNFEKNIIHKKVLDTSEKKHSQDTHDFEYDFDPKNDSSDDNDSLNFDFDNERYIKKYDEQYDSLFATYDRKSKKSLKGKKTFEEDFHDNDFTRIKSYYDKTIHEDMLHKRKNATYAKFICILIFSFFTLFAGRVFYKIHESNATPTYIQSEVLVEKPIEKLKLDPVDVQALRKNVQKHNPDVTLINKEPVLTKDMGKANEPMIAKEIVKAPEPILVPAVVNNYNFEQLNTGLATLGYSLLACLAMFFSFKGLSILGKSYKIKKEIKKSKQLIANFKVGHNDNQLAIGQLIADQIILNNIFIERLGNNNNVVELMTINEKLKDTSNFINNSLINNFKGD